MHTIYKTRAFVLSRTPYKEHDALITLFTEEFGRVRAQALGVRKESSKLRFSLQPFSHSKVALVQTREAWRITGAEVISQPYYDARHSLERDIFRRLFRVVERLVIGEEAHPELYTCLCTIMQDCIHTAGDSAQRDAFEHVSLLRICALLGYIPAHEIVVPYLHNPVDDALLVRAQVDRPVLVRYINNAFSESHL